MENGSVIHVSAIQMNCVLGDVKANLEKAARLVEEAARQQASLIVLPELFNTGYRVEENDVELAESIPGPTTAWMEQQAKNSGAILVGAILEQGISEGLVYDTSVAVGPNGLIGSYRKTHLWEQENVRFTKGDRFPVFDTPFGRIGMQICYEIGFPEGTRILSLKGADLLLCPSAFGKQRLYVWDLATRARALENGVFLIASNRSGVDKSETAFAGHSRIVNPRGEILAEATEDDEAVVVSIDLKQVAAQRRAVPYLRDLNKRIFSEDYFKLD